MEKIEIDYLTEECTDKIAFVIYYESECSVNKYKSPFIFNSVEDAYHAACIEVSGR